MDTKFGANVSNRMLLNAAKFQGYSLYGFLVIKGKPTGWGLKLPPPPHTHTQIRVKVKLVDGNSAIAKGHELKNIYITVFICTF